MSDGDHLDSTINSLRESMGRMDFLPGSPFGNRPHGERSVENPTRHPPKHSVRRRKKNQMWRMSSAVFKRNLIVEEVNHTLPANGNSEPAEEGTSLRVSRRGGSIGHGHGRTGRRSRRNSIQLPSGCVVAISRSDLISRSSRHPSPPSAPNICPDVDALPKPFPAVQGNTQSHPPVNNGSAVVRPRSVVRLRRSVAADRRRSMDRYAALVRLRPCRAPRVLAVDEDEDDDHDDDDDEDDDVVADTTQTDDADVLMTSLKIVTSVKEVVTTADDHVDSVKHVSLAPETPTSAADVAPSPQNDKWDLFIVGAEDNNNTVEGGTNPHKQMTNDTADRGSGDNNNNNKPPQVIPPSVPTTTMICSDSNGDDNDNNNTNVTLNPSFSSADGAVEFAGFDAIAKEREEKQSIKVNAMLPTRKNVSDASSPSNSLGLMPSPSSLWPPISPSSATTPTTTTTTPREAQRAALPGLDGLRSKPLSTPVGLGGPVPPDLFSPSAYAIGGTPRARRPLTVAPAANKNSNTNNTQQKVAVTASRMSPTGSPASLTPPPPLPAPSRVTCAPQQQARRPHVPRLLPVYFANPRMNCVSPLDPAADSLTDLAAATMTSKPHNTGNKEAEQPKPKPSTPRTHAVSYAGKQQLPPPTQRPTLNGRGWQQRRHTTNTSAERAAGWQRLFLVSVAPSSAPQRSPWLSSSPDGLLSPLDTASESMPSCAHDYFSS